MRSHARCLSTLGALLLVLIPVSALEARDGELDAGFGIDGSLILPFPGNLSVQDFLLDIERLADGRLLVSAAVDTGSASGVDMGVMRLSADGVLDTGFGSGGARLVAFDRPGSDLTDIVRDVIVQPDGRIVLVGDAAGGIGGIDMAVARLLANGNVDTSFGNQGKATIAFDLGATAARRNDQAVRGIVQADGGILIAGMALTATGAMMAVARLTAAGLPDPAFDGDGKRLIDFGGGLTDQSLAYNVLASRSGNRIYVLGLASLAGNVDMAIARLESDGSLDTGFGGDGTVTVGFDIGGTDADLATGAIEQADGRVVLCGGSSVAAPRDSDFACLRLHANGDVDNSFLPALIPIDLTGPGTDDSLSTHQDAQGRLLLVGYSTVGTNSFHFDFALSRLRPDGQLDPDFGIDGRMRYASSPETGDDDRINRAYSLVFQPDGKLVLVGAAAVAGGGTHVQLVRVIGDSLFDQGFELPLPWRHAEGMPN